MLINFCLVGGILLHSENKRNTKNVTGLSVTATATMRSNLNPFLLKAPTI